MKNRIMLFVGVAMVALGAALAGCGAREQKQPESTSAQPETARQTAQQQADVYPINWCVVSGEELGRMGDPFEHEYNGRKIKFCCKNCLKTFQKNPAGYIARLDSAAAGLITQPEPMEEHEEHEHEGHEHGT